MFAPVPGQLTTRAALINGLDDKARAEKAQAEKLQAKQVAQAQKEAATLAMASGFFQLLAESNQDKDRDQRPFIVNFSASDPGKGKVVFDVFPGDVADTQGAFVASVGGSSAHPDIKSSLTRTPDEQKLYDKLGPEDKGHLVVTYNVHTGSFSLGNSGLKNPEDAIAAYKNVFEVLAKKCIAQDPNAGVVFNFASIQKQDVGNLAKGFLEHLEVGQPLSGLTLPAKNDSATQEVNRQFLRQLAVGCQNDPELALIISEALTQDKDHKGLFDKYCKDVAARAQAQAAQQAGQNTHPQPPAKPVVPSSQAGSGAGASAPLGTPQSELAPTAFSNQHRQGSSEPDLGSRRRASTVSDPGALPASPSPGPNN